MARAKLLVMFSLLLVITAKAAAQAKPAAVLVTKISDEETNAVFTDDLSKFLKVIVHSPRTTRGFIAIASNVDERHRIAKQLLSQNKNLKPRVTLSLPGTLYDPGFNTTEFWLIPKGAVEPYKPHTYDISCPTITIAGPLGVTKNEKLVFTANISGSTQDSAFRVRWTIQGGKIVNGARTPFIRVKVIGHSATVTATVKILWLDDDYEFCANSESFTLKLDSINR